MSSEDPSPSKKQRIEMEPESEEMKEETEAVAVSRIVLSVHLRPEAPSLEAFLLNPEMYKPSDEFLGPPLGEDETVLTQAVKQQNIAAVATLLEAGADPNMSNKKGVTPVSAASHKGNTIIMQLLINAGASVNTVNQSGSTALIQASHFGHINAVELLLRNNANADFQNLKGTTALMRASQEGHVEISKMLINSRVDVNRKNHEGMNALMLASQRGHADMVMVLILACAAMDEQTSQGSTALMLACKRGHEKCVEVLVSMGAEIFMRDGRGRTARDTATKRGHNNLIGLLDTQRQIQRVQEYVRGQRSTILLELRDAAMKGRLQLCAAESRTNRMIDAVRASLKEKGDFTRSLSVATPRDLQVAVATTTTAAAADKEKDVNNNSDDNSEYSRGSLAVTSTSASVCSTASLSSATMSLTRGGISSSYSRLLSLSAAGGGGDATAGFAAGGGAEEETDSYLLASYPNAVNLIENLLLDTAEFRDSPLAAARATTTTAAATDDNLGGICGPSQQQPQQQQQPGRSTASGTCSTSVLASVRDMNMPSLLQHRHPGYAEWQWTLLLYRCMQLPPGVFELIADMLPMPRVWQWSLSSLRRRCKLAPLQSITDLSIIMDEMLLDANIFGGNDQHQLLIRVNRNPEVIPFLSDVWGMSAPLIESIRTWSDIQSIQSRTTDLDIAFKPPLARRMLSATLDLFKWAHARNSSTRVLGMPVYGTGAGGDMGDDHDYGIDDDASDGDGAAMDQDTETEMQADGEQEDNQDADSDIEIVPVPHHAGLVMGFGF